MRIALMTDIVRKLLGLAKILVKINTAVYMRFATPLNIKLSASASMATWAIHTRNAVRKEFAKTDSLDR
jgi:hypothetical protein